MRNLFNSFKLSSMALALAIMSIFAVPAAQAQTAVIAVGQGVIAGNAQFNYNAAVAGDGNAMSQGTAVAASNVAGNGFSAQKTDSNSGAVSSVYGNAGIKGTDIATNTSQYANVNSTGAIGGEGVKAFDGAGKILNGTTGYATGDSMAKSTSGFSQQAVGQISAIGQINAIAATAVIR